MTRAQLSQTLFVLHEMCMYISARRNAPDVPWIKYRVAIRWICKRLHWTVETTKNAIKTLIDQRHVKSKNGRLILPITAILEQTK